MALSILFVDDEPDLEILLNLKFRKMLATKQWVFSFCQNGKAAFDQLQAAVLKPDVLVSDINMPLMDGVSLVTEAKQLQPNLKTYIMSAYDDPENIKKARNAGVEGFISKPLDLKAFEALLHRLDGVQSASVASA